MTMLWKPLNGYDIQIHTDLEGEQILADIKYPCGELVQGWECETISEAQQLIEDWLKNNPKADHKGCTNEYCTGMV